MSKESALATVAAPAAPAATESPVTNPAVPQPDAARFAALARKEAQIVRDRETFKKEQAAHVEEKARVQAVLKKAQEFEDLRKTDRIGALKAIGLTDNDIFELLADQEPPKQATPEERAAKAAETAVEAKIKAFQDGEKKKQEQAEQDRDKKIVANFKSEMGNFIEKNKDTYEFCAFHGDAAQEMAYEIVVEGLRSSNGEELIDMKEAIEMVEQYYEEQDEAMSALKKRQAKNAPAPEPVNAGPVRSRTVTPGDPNYRQAPTIQRTRTLSNDARPNAAAVAPKNETRDQKRERLISQIRTHGLRK